MHKLKIIDELKLIYFEPGETFSPKSVIGYIDALNEYEIDTSQYKRFFNISKMAKTSFSYDDIKNMTDLTKKFRVNNPDTKVCFYCKNLGIEKLTTLFSTKMKPDFTNYFSTESLEECAEFLDIDINILLKAF